MRIELTDVTWLEDQQLSIVELSELSGLPSDLLIELVQAGGIEPLEHAAPEPRFGAAALSAARHAHQLQQDFELDATALLLVLGLLDRVRELQGRIQELQAKLPRRLP